MLEPAILQAILAGQQPRRMSLLWFQRNLLPTDGRRSERWIARALKRPPQYRAQSGQSVGARSAVRLDRRRPPPRAGSVPPGLQCRWGTSVAPSGAAAIRAKAAGGISVRERGRLSGWWVCR